MNDVYFDCIDESDMSWMSDSSASESYSDSETSVLSFDDNHIPEFAPSMFRHIPSHMSSAYQFQVELNSLFDRNKASLTMYDEIIRLLNSYISSSEFNRNIVLKSRKQFMDASEKMFNIQSLQPIHGNVTLCNNTAVTVPIFDAQAMILSLLHDPTIMKKENLAPGYDIFTGAVDDSECNNFYGEIHTGDRWAPALTRHCGKDGQYMPIALVLFEVFVKAPGLKTKRRVSEFAVQTAKQHHHAMIARHAYTSMSFGNALVDNSNSSSEVLTPAMDGKYSIDMAGENVEETLSFLHDELVEFYHDNWKEICRRSGTSTTIITGYTRGRHIDDEGHQTIFYAHPSYRGSPWYDWAYVHFVEGDDDEVYYPSWVLGLFETDGGVEAVIHCSSKPLKWSVVEKKMFVSFDLGTTKASIVSVPLDSFVYPLCVLEDHGGPSNRYVIVLPRRGWVQHFGRDID